MVLLGLSSNSSDQSPILKSGLNETNQNETEQFLIEEDKPSFYNYLPLCAIILGAIGYHIGISPITWSYMGKLLLFKMTNLTEFKMILVNFRFYSLLTLKLNILNSSLFDEDPLSP